MGEQSHATVINGAVSQHVNDPWLASGTDVNVAVGFQPFVWATSGGSNSHTTSYRYRRVDTGSLIAGDPVTMT